MPNKKFRMPPNISPDNNCNYFYLPEALNYDRYTVFYRLPINDERYCHSLTLLCYSTINFRYILLKYQCIPDNYDCFRELMHFLSDEYYQK